MKSLSTRRPPGRSSSPQERDGAVCQLACAGLVGVADAGELRGQVAQDDVGLSIQKPADLRDRRGVADVAGDGRDLRRAERLDWGEVDTDHPAGRAHPVGCDLHPGTRPGSEVDDHVPGSQETMTVVELDQLVGAAGAVSGARGRADSARPCGRTPGGVTGASARAHVRGAGRRFTGRPARLAGRSTRPPGARVSGRPPGGAVRPRPAQADRDPAHRRRCTMARN